MILQGTSVGELDKQLLHPSAEWVDLVIGGKSVSSSDEVGYNYMLGEEETEVKVECGYYTLSGDTSGVTLAWTDNDEGRDEGCDE